MIFSKKFLLLLSFLLIFVPGLLKSQESKKDTIEERLARIEANQLNFEKRLDDLQLNIDRRFEGVDKRFDDLRFWLQFILGAMVLMIGAVITQWMLVWRKVDRIEARVEERIVIGYRVEEIQELRKRLEKLEAAIAK